MINMINNDYFDNLFWDVYNENSLDKHSNYYQNHKQQKITQIMNKNSDNSAKPTLSLSNGKLVAEWIDGAGNIQDIYVKNETGNSDYIPSINDQSGEFYQVPNGIDRLCMYVCAPNQSGKTTYVARFLETYIGAYPHKDVIVFSKLFNDPILDKFHIKRVNLTKFDNKNALERLTNSLVIFDDYDQISDKSSHKMIIDLINEILCNGAHYHIDIIITHHLLTDYKNTRTILNECSIFVIFPQSGSEKQREYLLKLYFGMSTQQIQSLKKLNSRWVILYKNYPQMVLYNHGIYLL